MDGSKHFLDAPHKQSAVIFSKSMLDQEGTLGQQITAFLGVTFKDDVEQQLSGDYSNTLAGQVLEERG